ncbi:hypothetical protein PM082_006559 [Marasmius tenuissimus]|nr:hypothetical protein PM082_006559 [Marasmius tenuissimus]
MPFEPSRDQTQDIATKATIIVLRGLGLQCCLSSKVWPVLPTARNERPTTSDKELKRRFFRSNYAFMTVGARVLFYRFPAFTHEPGELYSATHKCKIDLLLPGTTRSPCTSRQSPGIECGRGLPRTGSIQ